MNSVRWYFSKTAVPEYNKVNKARQEVPSFVVVHRQVVADNWLVIYTNSSLTVHAITPDSQNASRPLIFLKAIQRSIFLLRSEMHFRIGNSMRIKTRPKPQTMVPALLPQSESCIGCGLIVSATALTQTQCGTKDNKQSALLDSTVISMPHFHRAGTERKLDKEEVEFELPELTVQITGVLASNGRGHPWVSSSNQKCLV